MNHSCTRNGILVCAGIWEKKNIGDYIQSVAQEQFFDHIDTYVEREEINTFHSEGPTKVIMNAWWMWNPENFPPSPSIKPLFLSMHIVPSIADKMLTPKSIAYLKKHEPIGARNIGTKELLERHGIKSYFSGCLTLTLGRKYKSTEKDNSIYFVDPYYELGGGHSRNRFSKLLYSLFLLAKHYQAIKPLYKKFVFEFHSSISHISAKLDKLLHLASFYESYSNVFSKDVLYSATYLTHNVSQAELHYNNDEKMECARQLIKKYSKARLVITSRIHCALPCLGIETPVIFITSPNLEKGTGRCNSNGRFGGLIELLNVMEWTPKGIVNKNVDMDTNKICLDTAIQNSQAYTALSNKLIYKAMKFIGLHTGGGKLSTSTKENNSIQLTFIFVNSELKCCA